MTDNPTPGQTTRGKRATAGKRKNTDDESGEAAKKRMRSLEDKIKKVADANEDLRTEVKSLKKKALASNNEDYGSNESEQDTSDSDQVHDTSRGGNDPLLFSSRRITVKSRGDPDKSNRKRHAHDEEGDQHQPPPRPSPSPAHDEPDLEHVNTPAGSSAPGPSHNEGGVLPPASNDSDVPPSPAMPAHPWDPAPFAPGVDSKTPKNANKVYDTAVASMLNEAEHQFECLLFVENAYPNLDTQIMWSSKCWENTCIDSHKFFELSKEMRNLIKGRCSHGRGAILQRVRPVIDTLFDMNVSKASVVRKNSTTAKKLLAGNAFYYPSLITTLITTLKMRYSGSEAEEPAIHGCVIIDRGKHGPSVLVGMFAPVNDYPLYRCLCYDHRLAASFTCLETSLIWAYFQGIPGDRCFESKTILCALKQAFFAGSRSPAATDRAKFDPIPLPLIALVCTIFEHCLREWESGKYVSVNLNESVDGTRYRTHKANAISWQGLNKDMTTHIREHLSKNLFASCGLEQKEIVTTGLISQEVLDSEKAALDRGRTFERDSSPEPDDD